MFVVFIYLVDKCKKILKVMGNKTFAIKLEKYTEDKEMFRKSRNMRLIGRNASVVEQIKGLLIGRLQNP